MTYPGRAAPQRPGIQRAPLIAHYVATKLALEHLTLRWAIELAENGIRVNAVAPGPVKSAALTGMMGLPREKAREVEAIEAQQVPLGRRGQPGDIAEWIIALGPPGDQRRSRDLHPLAVTHSTRGR